MPVKTVTTWTAPLSEEHRLNAVDELELRALAGKTDGMIETHPNPGGATENTPPYTSTRIWLTEDDAKDWVKWMEENIPGGHHSTEIIV